jgi:putative PIN family toxin of toxin-antitoxin system
LAGTSYRVVLDTNVVLRALVSGDSPAARILGAAESRAFVTLLSRPVLAEYRAALTDAETVERFPSLSRRRVDLTLARLRFISDYLRDPRTRFSYPRDPRDAKFIELAIAGRATHIISGDRDLLALPNGRGEASRRFRQRLPRVSVMTPNEFWRVRRNKLGIGQPE